MSFQEISKEISFSFYMNRVISDACRHASLQTVSELSISFRVSDSEAELLRVSESEAELLTHTHPHTPTLNHNHDAANANVHVNLTAVCWELFSA